MNLKLKKTGNEMHWITDQYHICAKCGRELEFGFYCKESDKCFCVTETCNNCHLITKYAHIHTKFFFDGDYDTIKTADEKKLETLEKSTENSKNQED